MAVDVIQSPPDEPLRSDPTNFAAKREAWLTWEKDHLFPGLNAAIAGFNPLLSNYEKIVGAANFKGLWSALSGPLTVPASVAHVGKVYVLLQDAANVAAEVPGVSSKWAEVSSGLPEQFTGAASLASLPTTVSFTDTALQNYRDLLFLFRGVSHNSGSTRAVQIQLSSDLTNWMTALTISGALAATSNWNGRVWIQDRGERNAYLGVVLDAENTGATPTQGGSDPRVARMIRTNSNIKGVRFLLDGADAFNSGTIIPFGIGAPLV